MGIFDWAENNPKEALLGAGLATAAVLARGRLSEAVFGNAKTMVTAGAKELAPGVQVERLGNNLRFTAEDGLAVDVTSNPLGRLLGRHTVTAQLPDRSAFLSFDRSGYVSVNTDGAFATTAGGDLKAKIDGLATIKRSPDSYNGSEFTTGRFDVKNRSFEGPGFRLWTGQLSGPGDRIDVWGASFGGRSFDDFGMRRGGMTLTPGAYESYSRAPKPPAIGYDGVSIDGKVRSFNEIAKMFERKV